MDSLSQVIWGKDEVSIIGQIFWVPILRQHVVKGQIPSRLKYAYITLPQQTPGSILESSLGNTILIFLSQPEFYLPFIN